MDNEDRRCTADLMRNYVNTVLQLCIFQRAQEDGIGIIFESERPRGGGGARGGGVG